MKPTIILVAGLIITLFGACNKNNKPQKDFHTKTEETTVTKVEYEILSRKGFAQEILSNGVLSSQQKAEVKWKASDVIRKIYAKNGDYVRKGQVLAQLDQESANLSLIQSQDTKARAMLDMQDFLIGQGYKLSDTTKIPIKIRAIARLRSGYKQAELTCRTAKIAIRNTVLIAPISGMVANLTAKENNYVSIGETFCSILGGRQMEISFPLMENEVAALPKGVRVEVSLFSDENEVRYGTVKDINPLVGEDGFINVQAVVSDAPHNWFDGMKAKIRVQKMEPHQLVIAKQAVVIRDGKQVVFTIHNGRAYWNYVKLDLENSRYYTVEEGLKSGDSVIIEGNVHLAHLSPIVYTKGHSK